MRRIPLFAAIWSAVLIFTNVPALAQHDLDLLYGHENGSLRVMQPEVHPVRPMVMPTQNRYLLDVGMDFFVPDGAPGFMLQRCRVVQVYISPGLTGTKSGIGTVFSSGNTPNYFDLPYLGTPHHHFIFSASAPGVYLFDLRAVNGRDDRGNPLMDMSTVYRIYMVAGNPPRFFGQVLPSPLYTGAVYGLWLRVRASQNGTTRSTAEQPINPWAIYAYLVALNGSGNAHIGAKLEKHLSVRVSRNLGGAQQMNLTFPYLGDTNEDDRIDSIDLQHVAQHFGGGLSSADLNGDSTVNLHDLYAVLVSYARVGEDSD